MRNVIENFKSLSNHLKGMSIKVPYTLVHLGRRLMGRYIGEGPQKLGENIGNILDRGLKGIVIVRKPDGTEVRGLLANWDSAEFNFSHYNGGSDFSLRPEEIYRSYFA